MSNYLMIQLIKLLMITFKYKPFKKGLTQKGLRQQRQLLTLF
jgi:hypothetical protein